MKQWTDEKTGRTVRQLTDLAEGACVDYFRIPKHLPGGLILARGKHGKGNVLLIEPESGDVQPLNLHLPGLLTMRESDGKAWYADESGQDIWEVDLPTGSPHRVAEIQGDTPGSPVSMACDGRTVVLCHTVMEEDRSATPFPTTTAEVTNLWRLACAPRHSRCWAYDLLSETLTELASSMDCGFFYFATSPVDPDTITFALFMMEGMCQRVWAVQRDGSNLRRIRPQDRFEWITHEFWWPDGRFIGYKYQDRRGDETYYRLPWGEYSPRPTHFCLAKLSGEEVYQSDPLNHYHSHIFVSPDGSMLCGEGTDGHSFVYAAPFSMGSPRIDFVPLATIHTEYLPSAGQQVNAGFSQDNRWLLYNDTVADRLQVCAVKVDV